MRTRNGYETAKADVARRAADVVLDVPLSELPPGPYLLTVDATAGGTTVRRQSRFEIVRSY